MQNKILYAAIIALFGIILLQRCFTPKASAPASIVKIDTVYQQVLVKETVQGKPIVRIKTQLDTQWLESINYISDTNYPKLLEDYQMLADKLAMKSVYQTTFNVKYGKAKVIDTIGHNMLINSSLELDLNIPEKIVMKPIPPVRQVYVGFGILGVQSKGVTGGFVGGLYKDKKDRVFGANLGVYDNKLYYGASNYWKIKK